MKSLTFSCAALFLSAAPVFADWLDDAAQLDVLPGWRTAEGTHMAAFRIVLGDGWKTYWRAPGTAGIPPAFDWTGSQNMDAIEFHWTVPEIQRQNGLRVLGYEHQMVLPIEIAVTDTNATTRLAGEMQIGVCKDICVPVTLNFDTVLPSQGSRDGTIVGAMLAQPFTAEEAGGAVATCRLRPIDDGLELTADVRVDQVGPGEIGVLEVSDPLLWVSEADYTRSGERVSLQADIIHPEGKPIALDRSGVRISLIASNGVALDIRGCTSG